MIVRLDSAEYGRIIILDSHFAPPFGLIARCFKSHSITPFLGAAASTVGAQNGRAVHDVAKLSKHLSDLSEYPVSTTSLGEVAQYIDEVAGDRRLLQEQIEELYHSNIGSAYSTKFTRFLGSLPIGTIPRMLMTTNYDTLIERSLEHRGIEYLAICHIQYPTEHAGRFVCYQSLNEEITEKKVWTRTELDDWLFDNAEQPIPAIVYYKLHGTALPISAELDYDSVVITENDYVRILETSQFGKLPLWITERLQVTRLLFLGYSLRDWNLRILLYRLRKKQDSRLQKRRHWACSLAPDPVEEKFWGKRGVGFYDWDLANFLDSLGESLRSVSK